MQVTGTTQQYLKSAAGAADTTTEGRLKKACRDFESLMLQQMLSSMHKSIPDGGLFGESPGQEIYQSLRDEELAKTLADRGGLGLADALYRQMSRKP